MILFCVTLNYSACSPLFYSVAVFFFLIGHYSRCNCFIILSETKQRVVFTMMRFFVRERFFVCKQIAYIIRITFRQDILTKRYCIRYIFSIFPVVSLNVINKTTRKLWKTYLSNLVVDSFCVLLRALHFI